MFYLAPLLAASPQDVRKRKSAAGPFDALSSAPGQVRSPSSVARASVPLLLELLKAFPEDPACLR